MYSLAALIDMGEYNYFVWPAYGVFCIVLIALMIESRSWLKKAKKDLAALSPDTANKSSDKEVS